MAVLCAEYHGSERENGTDIEREIREYIKKYAAGGFDDALAADDRWGIFYHLSPMRESVLNWYDFKKDSRLLEIGGEFGALTGMFCRRCAHVAVTEASLFRAEAICERHAGRENLTVYAGRLEDIRFDGTFDYIVLSEALERAGKGSPHAEPYVEYLKKLSALLKPDGKILLAVSNRYGIRYFCGEPDPYTGKPFSGINRSAQGAEGHLFDRREITDILDAAGFERKKFYYPLPDHTLAQLIYSEEYLPEENIRERLFFYHKTPETLVAMENQIYADLIRNRVFEFFANSYLIECAREGDLSAQVYAAVTTDRGPRHALATVICSDHTVLKRPLYETGKASVREVYDNLTDIRGRGIKVVPCRYEEGILSMPYVDGELLSAYLGRVVKTDKQEFISLVDKLYQCILDSSEHAGAGENELLSRREDLKEEFGIILKKAYIDMIPLNCFYIDGEPVFFDQEFVKQNYPAKFTLYRALKYIYLFGPYIEEIVPLQKMKERYGMDRVWSIFEEEENRFVAENRKYDVYDNFYKWVWIDGGIIPRNIERLAGTI